jgi:MFS family permease
MQLEITTDLTARLDRLPWCRFHTTVTVALGIGWTLAAFQTTIIGGILGQVTKLWHLSATQGSYLVSAWVVGIAIGAMLFGYYADRKGRKKMFIFSLVWYAAFSVAAAFSWNFTSLLAFRFLTALAIGGEYSAVMAAMVEFIPKRHRGKTSALILAGYPLGGVLSALTSLYCLNHLPANLGWRIGFGLGGVLAILGLWIRFAIPESPRWLLTHGFADKAEGIVRAVENSAAVKKESSQVRQADQSVRDPDLQVNKTAVLGMEQPNLVGQIKELFSVYFGRLFLACSLNFAQASVNYGMMSLLGLVVLPTVKVPAEQMPFFYMIGSAAAFGGSLFAAFLLDTWGRKGTVLLGYILTTLGIFHLYYAKTPADVLLAYPMLLFSLIWASNSAYIVTSEILPVRNRSTGLGISVAAGRVGAFTAPILLSSIFMNTHKAGLALLGLAIMSLPGPLAALIWCFKGMEGKNRSLEEISHETDGLANGRK